jgi:hypothetical protein
MSGEKVSTRSLIRYYATWSLGKKGHGNKTMRAQAKQKPAVKRNRESFEIKAHSPLAESVDEEVRREASRRDRKYTSQKRSLLMRSRTQERDLRDIPGGEMQKRKIISPRNYAVTV